MASLDVGKVAEWYSDKFGLRLSKALDLAEAHMHEFPSRHPKHLSKAELRQVRNYAKYSR